MSSFPNQRAALKSASTITLRALISSATRKSRLRYAQESSWREDNRRVSNGDQVNRVAALAMKRGKSADFTGYWQRHIG